MEQTFIIQTLTIVGASIFGLLGTTHLIYTFFSNKFNAVDPKVTQSMQTTAIALTRDTTIWKAWIGFNASHSLGALLIAAFYIHLALFNMPLVITDLYYLFLAVAFSFAYLALAIKYWFKIPMIGISLSTLCFLSAFVLNLTH